MRSDLDFSRPELFGPVVFRPAFNGAEGITAVQAWSLFFTAGKADNCFGFDRETGRLFTNLLIAFLVSSSIGAAIFTSNVF